MKPLATLRTAFGVDASGTLVTIGSLLVAFLELARSQWATAAIFLISSAIFGSIILEEVAPDSMRFERWGKVIRLAAEAGLLVVACVSALGGDFVFAAGLGLAIVLGLAIPFASRTRLGRGESSP